MSSLADAVVRVRERIATAARHAGRDPAQVRLVAVTKTVPVEVILQAYSLGLRDFGENRVEEAQGKISDFRRTTNDGQLALSPKGMSEERTSNLQSPISNLHFHMIGHLQSRKARDAIGLFDVIHSVDRLKLARKLSRLCVEARRVMPILLECNVSGEASKYGFRVLEPWSPDWDFLASVEAIVGLPGLRVEGLMTMAPIVSEPEEARPVFVALRQLSEGLSARFGSEHFGQLSMGMTDDFEVAVEEGATMVRIGRALFGGI